MESFRNLDDETFPSFLYNASAGSGDCTTLGNVTLASSLGVPMAASTVAKIRATADNRLADVQASYLEGGAFSLMHPQGSNCEREEFALSFKDDLDDAGDFIAPSRFSDLLVKVNLDESECMSRTNVASAKLGAAVTCVQPSGCPDDISTGLLTFSHVESNETRGPQAELRPVPIVEESPESEVVDSDGISGSVASFLANEKLMSLDSMNSDATDDDGDMDHLHDEELKMYFKKLVPPAMQRGRVEGQEIPVGDLPGGSSQPCFSEPDASSKNNYNFLDNYHKETLSMSEVRLAATGMDSCPASDEEDTEDELEVSQSRARARFLLPSTSRQLVGESHRPHFRPGLEGGSSDDEPQTGAQIMDSRTGIEHRRSAEGQVIDSPITGDGGGGDGSSGSEEDGNDGGVSTIPPPPGPQSSYDMLRAMGIVGENRTCVDGPLSQLPGVGRAGLTGLSQMGDRVGPVGTGETEPSDQGFGAAGFSSVSRSMNQDRHELLDATDSSHSARGSSEEHFDSIYFKAATGCKPQDSSVSVLQDNQNSFHFSFGKNSFGKSGARWEREQTMDHLGECCTNSIAENPGETLEAKYLSQSDIWNHRSGDLELEFQKGADGTHSVVYQNEEGKWVTDLAYYSSFVKEMGATLPEDVAEDLANEDFIGGSQAMDKIVEDQKVFEEEHQFMQEEKIEPVNTSVVLGDTSWKVPASSHILMRASQVSNEFEKGNQSYLRISLGEFFQQRSEALGCLGKDEFDIKRPSFGYVINSPEKREPFALLRPSDFSSRDSSVHSGAVQLSEADDTLNPEDLEKTLEPTPSELPSSDAQPPGQNNKVPSVSLLNNEENLVRSSESPNSSNCLSLSITTIASAIADASISTDPVQLATLIMELSKKRSSQSKVEAVPSSGTASEQTCVQDVLQKTSSLGDLSALDMEKYLRMAEASSSDSDASSSQSCLDILSMADNLTNSYKPTQKQASGAPDISQHAEKCLVSNRSQVVKKNEGLPNAGGRKLNDVEVKRSDVKRSSIPRPKSSCISTATALPARRSVATGQSLTSPSACISKPGEDRLGGERSKSDSHMATTAGNRSCSESRVKVDSAQPQVSGTRHSLKSNDSAPDPSASVKTSPGLRSKGRSEVSSQKSSPHTSRTRNSKGESNTSGTEESCALKSPKTFHTVTKEMPAHAQQNPFPSSQNTFGSPEHRPSGVVEASHCSFRPSTSPLTHSSPSQTSLPSEYGELSPPSSSGVGKRSPGVDPLSPQSHCSSPSLSRLTYLSINENTTMPTPNHNKKNNTMSLSTTIIRSSPTPPLEPTDVNGCDIKDSNGDLGCSSKTLQKPYHAEMSDMTQKNSKFALHGQSESNFRKDLSSECVPGTHQSQLRPSELKELSTKQTPNVSGSGAESFLPAQYGLPPSSYKPEDLRYGLVPNYNFQSGLSDLTTGVPHLQSGRPLFSNQMAQPYLNPEGHLQTPSYHLGPYGVSAVMTGGIAQIGHAHAPGPTGLSSGYMNAGQHPHQYPIGKPYGPSIGPWPARNLVDLGSQVVVPDELKFPTACCVGIACQTSLSIFNPSERWQQVAISITSLSIDGVKVDSLPYQWLIVKNKTIIGPKSTEEQKVLLIAPRAGLYQCTLSVSSWPASAESETVAQAEVFAKKVVLIAVAENPSIEVDVGKTGCLDFGDLARGTIKAMPLKLVNRTRTTVPIRLVISANASAWHCFNFSKSPVSITADGPLHSGGPLTPVSAPSVINHVMHSSYGDNPDSFMVWVHFNAPQKFSTNSVELGPPDEYSARVDIEVDSPGPSHVIQSVALRARSGTARVHAPKDLQTVCLQAKLGETAKQTLPLKNAGNIDVQLRLKSNEVEGCFMVKPEELLLRTGEEQSLVVTFTPQASRKYRESVLTILVLPSGPQYEVGLKGELIQENSAKSLPSVPAVLPHCEVPPILSNKQFMAWGGVTLGRAVQQKLVLRNNSPTTSQHLRLLIRGHDQDCFQLQSTFGPDERLTRTRELLIKAKEDVAVHLLFAPTRVASMLAKLEIKQSAVRPSQPGVKFTIPLSGYGGTSNLILEDLRKRSDGYVATLSGVQTGRVSKLCVCVRNTGSRAAFVRVVPYSDLDTHTVMDSSVISLSPSQFVLKERTQEVITVVMKASHREQTLCQSRTALLATVCLFCGDEVSRQQFRKLLNVKPEAGKKVLSETSLLKDISFDEVFLGEETIHEVYDLPQRPNEAQLFYANMNKIILSLLGTVEMSDSGESDNVEFVRPSQQHTLDSDSGLGTSERHFSNVSLDVLPVKGPPLSASEPMQKQTEPDNTWSIQPEQLVLTAPTINGAADTRHVKILNHSNRELSFELSWPAHCLTITPQHGVIEPQSHLRILISPNPSLATKSAMLPWSGQIYIQCDKQQKFIKVQIRRDLSMDVSSAGSPSDRSLCPLPPQVETPLGPGFKSMSCSPQTQVAIKNRTVVFPTTLSGESSECSIEMENSGEEVRWYLSSFAPPYVKGVDGGGDVYRATYTVFRCDKMSGMLGVKEKLQVPFTFLPRDGGDYAQFWDLECHPVAKPQQKSRVRFQLCGVGKKVGAGVDCKEEFTLARSEDNGKSRSKVQPVGPRTGVEASRRGVYLPQSLYTFPPTRVGEVSTLKVNFRNNSANMHELRFLSPTQPFYIKHSKYSLRTQHYINLPVQFKPTAVGRFSGLLLVQTDTDVKLSVELSGEALP